MASGFMQQKALQFWFSPSGKTAATLKKMSHCSNWKGRPNEGRKEDKILQREMGGPGSPQLFQPLQLRYQI